MDIASRQRVRDRCPLFLPAHVQGRAGIAIRLVALWPRSAKYEQHCIATKGILRDMGSNMDGGEGCVSTDTNEIQTKRGNV